jgi:alanine racemase
MLTWVEIEKEALKHNLNQFRKHIGVKKLLMPVLKSNAYGHGLKDVAKICEKHSAVDRICVVSLDEAIELLQINITKPIFILSFYDLEEKKLVPAIQKGVIFPLYTREQAMLLNRLGKKLHKRVKVHIKVDTGASRVGLLPKEALVFIKEISELPHIELEGLFSHFASSEDDKSFTFLQKERLLKLDQELKEEGIAIPLKHMACTASTILYPETHLDAVRIGLGIYGLYPSEKMKQKINLRPVLSMYTKIVHLKKLPSGTSVGYGRTWFTKRPTTLATIPTGYFDGYDRHLSNNAFVLIQGRRCQVGGRICMNLTMIDVTGLKNIKVGERVTLLGASSKDSVSADELAKHLTTINYEVISKINPLIPRVYK